MNIVEAINKLKIDNTIKIKRGNKEFCNRLGDIYSKINLSTNEVGHIKVSTFNIEDILSDDWEVIK
jgi:hypothetical protein